MKQDMQNGTIAELYTDDKKSKYSSNSDDILKSAKSFDQRSKLPLLNFLVNFLTQRKSQINNFPTARQTYF